MFPAASKIKPASGRTPSLPFPKLCNTFSLSAGHATWADTPIVATNDTTASAAISVGKRSFVSIGFSLLDMGQAQLGDPTNNQMGPKCGNERQLCAATRDRS